MGDDGRPRPRQSGAPCRGAVHRHRPRPPRTGRSGRGRPAPGAGHLRLGGRGGPALTVVLRRRADIDLQSFARVAWEGEDVAVAESALAEVARRRDELLALIAADPARRFYGVNVHAGDWS